MVIKKMLTTAMYLLLLFNGSKSESINRLISAENVNRRKLIQISFNNKICVDFGGLDWLTPYSGDYTYNGNMINGKPSYTMSTCRDLNNCKNGMTLSIGNDNKWYFNGQPSGTITNPFCNDATDTPNECNNWWSRQPQTITACGTIETGENHISQQDTDTTNACSAAAAAPKRTFLTQEDKNEILRQFNVQRQLHGQSAWTWSPILEAVALKTGSYCQYGHPMSGEEAVSICESMGGGDVCWAAGFQGGSWLSNNINVFIWDGYKNGDCVIDGIVTKGLVWGYMQDDHRRPTTGEEDTAQHTFTMVGCAFNYCSSNGGYLYCNYM